MKPLATEALEWTGERLVTTCNRPLVFEHLHRYAMACSLADGKRVLDIACGEGYGANLLARTAGKVIGVDLDAKTIAHAQAKYPHGNLEFLQGDCTAIPCTDHSVDLVVSFETIEHVREQQRFIAELRRVLTPGGVVIISSPDKAEYRAISGDANPFHAAELSHDEFVRLIQVTFKHCIFGRQRLVAGSWIGADGAGAEVGTETFRGGFNGVERQAGVYRGVYSIAVCSDEPLPRAPFGLFEDYELSAQVWGVLDRPETLPELVNRANQTTPLTSEIAEKRRHVEILQRDLTERSEQVAHFKAECERLGLQVQITDERQARAANELLDARWEALASRATILRAGHLDGERATHQELENRAEVAESERDHLRKIVQGLQTVLDTERNGRLTSETKLQTTTKELRAQQKQMARLRESLAHKLILPFGKSQRKFARLTNGERTDD